ncbi:MAG: pyridoxal-dependent decarboxylase [Janthinobacterium lividum]
MNYLGGEMPDFALNFSHPGGQVIAQYYLLIRFGRDGYRAVQQQAYSVARHLASSLAALGPFEMLFDGNPRRGIPAICWTLKPDDRRPFSLFDLSDHLRVRGWQVAAYTLPPDLQETAVMRALVRHGFTRDMADRLLDDVRDALGWFEKHPVQRPSGADEGSSDPHGGVHSKKDAT